MEELRWRLLWSILAVLIGTLIGFVVVTKFNVLEILINPVRPFLNGEKVKYLSPGDPFFITLKLAITVGLILAFPIVVSQIWAFVSPALMPSERRAIIPALYLGLLLFAAGVALAYYLVVPMTLKFMMSFQSTTLEENIVIGPYMAFVVKILLAFGILFELPVVVMVLAALGLITSKFMSEKRRYAIAGMAVIAAFVTPGDAVTLTVFMMGPLLLLYELSIGLAKLIERRRARSLVESVAIIAFLLAAAPANAQQPPQAADTTRPKTPREVVMGRLRTLNQSEQRDTTPRDTTAQTTPRPGTQRRPSTTAESPDFPTDSLMKQLLELSGFAATRYRGDQAQFNADSSTLVLFGTKDQKAGVLREGQAMVADSMLTFDQESNIACGYGKPVLTGGQSDAPLTAGRVCYNTRERIGMASGARTQISEGANWFVTGDLYTRGEDSYSHDAKFTDCSLDIPHYHFAAKEMKVSKNDVIVGRNVTLNFGDVPVFWLPFFMQSTKSGRRSGLLMPEFSVNDIVRRNAGYNRRIKDIGFYWAISEQLGALVSFDWWSNNYTALEGSFDYTFPKRFMQGGATFKRFWQNSGSTEFSVAANHSMEPNERTRIAMDAQYVTSSAFVEERSFDPRELRQTIASTLGVNRRFDWGSVSFQGSRTHYLSDDRKQLLLPSLGVTLSTINLWEGATWTGNMQLRRTIDDEANTEFDNENVNGNFGSTLNWGQFSLPLSVSADDKLTRHSRVVDGDTIVELRTTRSLNWNTGFGYQQRLIGTTTLTPSISISQQFLHNDTLTDNLVSAPVRMDIGATLKADVFGFLPGIGAISRIRHRLSPTISYAYSPSTAIDRADSIRAALFGARGGSERNTIQIGLSQTFEGKYRESEEQTQARVDSAAADSISADPTKPRRLPQARKVTILSLNTDAILYDFVAARETFRGVQTQQISNSVNSDLLRGLQLTVTHELFKEADTTQIRSGREFDPHLSRVSASFSLGSNSWLFRMLGLVRETEATPQTGSVETPIPEQGQGGPAPGPQHGIIGNRARDDQNRANQQNQPRGNVGSWNANFNLTLDRPRIRADEETETGSFAAQGSQMMTTNFTFQPTQFWNVNWSTGYSFTEKEFTDHILTFTRQLHDWDANFDFMKAQNGNFSFQFRVALRANPDIKFDYNQRSNVGQPRRTSTPQ